MWACGVESKSDFPPRSRHEEITPVQNSFCLNHYVTPSLLSINLIEYQCSHTMDYCSIVLLLGHSLSWSIVFFLPMQPWCNCSFVGY